MGGGEYWDGVPYRFVLVGNLTVDPDPRAGLYHGPSASRARIGLPKQFDIGMGLWYVEPIKQEME